MKKTFSYIKNKLTPYNGVIYFIVILLVCHFAWKFLVKGDETDQFVSFLGIDLTPFFNFMVNHTAHTTKAVLNFLGIDIQLYPNYVMKLSNDGFGIKIIWACTGIKQAYIFFCIIAFYRGPWLKKLWYIPAGLVVVYLYNIFRISLIVAVVQNHPSWFTFLHEYVLKYLFYVIIFGMWVLWEEKFVIKKPVKIVSKN